MLNNIAKITPFLLYFHKRVKIQKNLLHLQHISKGCQIPELVQDKTEIIPNEPGQVMLPREKDTLKYL